jgi:hypothetical protein
MFYQTKMHHNPEHSALLAVTYTPDVTIPAFSYLGRLMASHLSAQILFANVCSSKCLPSYVGEERMNTGRHSFKLSVLVVRFLSTFDYVDKFYLKTVQYQISSKSTQRFSGCRRTTVPFATPFTRAGHLADLPQMLSTPPLSTT